MFPVWENRNNFRMHHGWFWCFCSIYEIAFLLSRARVSRYFFLLRESRSNIVVYTYNSSTDDGVWRSGNHRINQLLNSDGQCKLLRGASLTCFLKRQRAMLINISVSVFDALTPNCSNIFPPSPVALPSFPFSFINETKIKTTWNSSNQWRFQKPPPSPSILLTMAISKYHNHRNDAIRINHQ